MVTIPYKDTWVWGGGVVSSPTGAHQTETAAACLPSRTWSRIQGLDNLNRAAMQRSRLFLMPMTVPMKALA